MHQIKLSLFKEVKAIATMGLLFLISMFYSCSSDSSEMPIFQDKLSDWNESLNEILTDNESALSSKGFSLEDVTLLSDMKLDSSLFFRDAYSYYPVYSKTDSTIEVLAYNKISENPSGYCLNTDALNNKIHQLLENADLYDIVQLTWKYGKQTFNSLALFNKFTCEMEFENLLFSIGTIDSFGLNEFKEILTRSESLLYNYTGTDMVSYNFNGMTCAIAGLNWGEVGHWLYYTRNNNSTIDTVYYYSHDFTSYSPISDTYADGFDTFVDFMDCTTAGANHYCFRYAIWAGPEGQFDHNTYNNIIYQNDCDHMPANYAGTGEGKIKTISKTPKWNNQQ